MLEDDAAAIVQEAQIAAEAGRLSRLVEPAPLRDYLRARRDGLAHETAARVSGLSIGSIKRWREWGRSGLSPYARFLETLQKIDAARVPALETDPILPDDPAAAESAVPSLAIVVQPSARIPSRQVLRMWAVRAEMIQAKANHRVWRSMVPLLWANLQRELAEYGFQLPCQSEIPAALSMGAWLEVFDAGLSAAGVTEGQPG